MPTRATYRLTPAAENDLADIWRYGTRTWSADQADRYLDTLITGFELIADQPEISRLRVEFTPPVRIFPTGAHLVVYQVGADGVTILRVLHNRRDLLAALDS
ncbi:toxin ParE1/3/4 [Aliiroseovarius sediminilitoris]|uniref:Toxin n=1 Tax=Aliiroseovarius sediminilitoris TaxID=1173584 RepID=A0A1I0R649_9RHOB|nr:type II toxin-antitoxin system RelE/ParE family toxin [Aliiroseovarius sediminilitoris]SEW36082.1 toxin ParE1/3/4 [Aliiroseovarius sediminilitoris]